jgi:hypothetical protein
VPVVPVLPGAPVVCAAATPMASTSMNDAHKVFFMAIAPWPGLFSRVSARWQSTAFSMGCLLGVASGICWPQPTVTVQ